MLGEYGVSYGCRCRMRPGLRTPTGRWILRFMQDCGLRWAGHIALVVTASLSCVAGCGNPVVGHGCPPGETQCGAVCVDLQTAHDNCGACDLRCAGDQACVDGTCRAITCDGDEIACDGRCVDPRTDGLHCGGCNVVCLPEQECRAGVCVGGTCEPPLASCSGVCVDLRVDPANCGGCGAVCAPTEVCQRGTCVAECLPGYTSCGGSCVDTSTDPLHCGACTVACAVGEVCEAGGCRSSCLPGHVDCGGACVDLTSDPDNCGACGTACELGIPCVEGVCRAPCPSGTTDCGGTCVVLSSDPFNCGTCGNRCGSGYVCRSSACILDCPPGLTGCAGECVDLSIDPAHCGSCERACLPTESCFAGTCLLECPDGYTPCTGSCVDLTSDADNCGACGRACMSGICDAAICSEEVPGHLVVVGHNFARFRRAQMLLLANAVFSLSGTNPVRVAALTAWTRTGTGTAANNVDLAISQAALERGRTWERTALEDLVALGSALETSDVLLIYEQCLAGDSDLRAAGAALAGQLDAFLHRGGIVLMTDARTGNNGSWQLLDAAGLFAATGCTDITDARVSVLAPGDAIASGVPLTYVAERDSVRFESAETSQVVGDGTAPVVIHKVVRP